MTVLIVDDEPLAREYLRFLLESQGVQIVGEAADGTTALQLAEDLQPDLLLLDIQMPGFTGLQLASALMHLDHAPLLVFVTGYSEYAVTAFERGALDYLVKPISPERLAQTLARAQERLTDREARKALRQQIAAQAHAATSAPLKRLPIRVDYTVRLIRVEDIVCAIARDKRVYVLTHQGEYRTYYTLKQLESLLPPDRFLRIHDSYLVNQESIEEVVYLGDHSYQVRLSNKQLLPVSRARYGELQHRLGLASLGLS
ncbi:MAG TPA: response regulator [Chthonomonadaceae bacterium]|nr:response regulator [Chthonomonadaceae bacterium]